MPRRPRAAAGGLCYHVLNRAVARHEIFVKAGDYAAFERVLAEALSRTPALELFTYCLMPNHWHLVLRPAADGELSEFMRWLTVTHTQRWHAHRHTAGTGHLYQGRFKSFPVEADEGHFLACCRYVERNALRANLCAAAEDWRWGALWRRTPGAADGISGGGDADAGPHPLPRLAAWPVNRPADWVARVNRPQTEAELDALRRSVAKGRPFGSDDYQAWTAEALGLESTFRERGRPRKATTTGEEAAREKDS